MYTHIHPYIIQAINQSTNSLINRRIKTNSQEKYAMTIFFNITRILTQNFSKSLRPIYLV